MKGVDLHPKSNTEEFRNTDMARRSASCPICVVVSVIVCIANASSAGHSAASALAGSLTRLSTSSLLFEPQSVLPWPWSASRNLALRGGGTPPVNEKDAAQLKGKTIAFVSAGYAAKKYILDIAHARGVKTIVFDETTSWASPSNTNTLDKEGKICKFIGMDMNRADEILVPDILEHLAQYTKETGDKIDGVCSFVELSTETAAKVAEALNLLCSPSKSVALARSKPSTRDCCEAAGLPKVTHYTLTKRSDINEALKEVNFPAIMKPISGVSSLGVLKVEKPEDLELCYDESTAYMKSVVMDAGGLLVPNGKPLLVKGEAPAPPEPPTSTSPPPAASAAQARLAVFVLEEFLDGYEVDIDLVMRDGKCVYRLLTDNGPCAPPYFSESWSLVPSVQLTEQQVKETEQLAIDSALAMGLTRGVFHVEAKYTSRGPRLIEFNARLGGGQVYETNLRATGVCLVVEALLLTLSLPPSDKMLRTNGDPLLSSVAGLVVSAPCSGTLPDVKGFLSKYRSLPGVSWMSPKVTDNQHIIGPDEGMPDWICIYLIDLAPGRGQAALDQCLEIEKLMIQDFLEEMHIQKSAVKSIQGNAAPHGPRRTRSVEWMGDASLTATSSMNAEHEYAV